MPDPAWLFAFLAASAFLGGAVNSVAGGGTLLTFPALLYALTPVYGPELAAAFANATSTVSLLPGSFAGAVGYRRELYESRRFVYRMLAPSVAGGLLGARLVGQDTKVFAVLVPWLILTAAVLFLVQAPVARWMKAHRPDHEPGPATQLGLVVFQFFVAVYGGYFGAGIGILMLSALGFMGLPDIHRMNGVKTLLAASINAASVVMFLMPTPAAPDGLIDWRYAGVMAAASVVGGYSGASVARRLPPTLVRAVVIVIGFGLAVWYFVRQYS